MSGAEFNKVQSTGKPFERSFSLHQRLFVISAFFILQLIFISYLPCREIYQHIVQMSVSQANNVTDHRHDCSRSSITLSHLPPLWCTGTRTPQLSDNHNQKSQLVWLPQTLVFKIYWLFSDKNSLNKYKNIINIKISMNKYLQNGRYCGRYCLNSMSKLIHNRFKFTLTVAYEKNKRTIASVSPLFSSSWYSPLKIILKQIFASGTANIDGYLPRLVYIFTNVQFVFRRITVK